MKRLTLIFSLMLALVGFNANAAMYIVGNNPFGEWDPANGVQMEETTPGVYTLNATLVQNDIWFIFTEGIGDWDTVNEGRYDSGNKDSDLTVYADVEFTPVKGNSGKSFAFSGTAGETYTFTFDTTTCKAMVSGYVAPINPLTGDLFVLGLVNGNNWNPSAGIEMATTDENVFTLTNAEVVNSGNGYGYFSFTSKLGENSNDWSFTAYRRGAQADGTLIENGVAAVLANWGSTGAFKVLPGTYDFEVNLSENTVTVTLKGDAPEDYYIVAGTPNLFSSEWNASDSANLMVKGENNLYTLTKTGFEATAGTVVQFKVVANANWSTCWPVSDENGDNNFIDTIAEDGVYTVTITFNEETKEITFNATKTGDIEPQVDNVYIIGDVNDIGWSASNGVQMTYNEGIYTATITTQKQENKDLGYFVFTKMLADTTSEEDVWNQIASYRFGPMCEGDEWVMTEALLGVECELDLEGESHSIAIPEGTWTVNVNLINGSFSINGTWPTDTVIPEPEMVYTVVGPEAIFGTDWNVADTTNNMVLNEETSLYTWSKDSVTLANSFEYKVVGNHSYDIYQFPLSGNNTATVEEAAIYNIVISFDPEAESDDNRLVCTLTKVADIEEPVEEMVYTVVGPEAIFGSNWNVEDTTNNMILNEETGLYTWSKDSVTVSGNFNFKVVGNHSYDIYQFPLSGDSTAIVEEEAIYNIVITFDPNAESDDNRLAYTLTKVGDIVVEHTYTVAGTENLFGSNWDPTDTNNDMTKGEDGIYTWTKTAEFTEAATIEFKVVQDHAWGYEWPSSNWKFQLNDAGTYDFVITFNPTTGDITFKATKQGDHTYTVAGAPASVFGTEWDSTNSANDMTLGEDGLYIWTKTVEFTDVDSIELKVLEDHAWSNCWPEANVKVFIDAAGTYTIVVTYNPETNEVIVTATAASAWELGDVNHDYTVDVSDVTMLISYVLGSNPDGFYDTEANVDGDEAGTIDVSDVTALISKVLGN